MNIFSWLWLKLFRDKPAIQDSLGNIAKEPPKVYHPKSSYVPGKNLAKALKTTPKIDSFFNDFERLVAIGLGYQKIFNAMHKKYTNVTLAMFRNTYKYTKKAESYHIGNMRQLVYDHLTAYENQLKLDLKERPVLPEVKPSIFVLPSNSSQTVEAVTMDAYMKTLGEVVRIEKPVEPPANPPVEPPKPFVAYPTIEDKPPKPFVTYSAIEDKPKDIPQPKIPNTEPQMPPEVFEKMINVNNRRTVIALYQKGYQAKEIAELAGVTVRYVCGIISNIVQGVYHGSKGILEKREKAIKLKEGKVI